MSKESEMAALSRYTVNIYVDVYMLAVEVLDMLL
jgi:hypothetical protein